MTICRPLFATLYRAAPRDNHDNSGEVQSKLRISEGVFAERENTPDEIYVEAMERLEKMGVLSPPGKRRIDGCKSGLESPLKQARLVEKMRDL